MRSNPEHYEYRAGVKEGWYEWLAARKRERETYLVTLTWSDAKLDRPPTAKWLMAKAVSRAKYQGLAGVLVAETARGDGRLHIHGVLHRSGETSGSVLGLTAKWAERYGFAHAKVVTDLMGAVTYIGKAVTADTLWEMLDNANL